MTSSNGNIFRVYGFLCGEFTGEFPTQRPVTRNFVVFFDLRLNKRLSKQSWGWWFETPFRSLWRHGNVQNSGLRLAETNIRILFSLIKRYKICVIHNLWVTWDMHVFHFLVYFQYYVICNIWENNENFVTYKKRFGGQLFCSCVIDIHKVVWCQSLFKKNRVDIKHTSS